MPPNERVENVEDDYDEKAQKFWSNYVSEAAQYDKHLTENWKGNMDSALIFAGLFSAVVSAFIIESYKLLKEDSSDMTNVLLTQILAVQMAILSSNSSSIPLIPTATPSMKFTLSPTAITVNILWFLSLVCSLAAAFVMILIQQWIRDYLQRIERNSDPLRRARNRIFLSNGMERWQMDVVVHYVPTLLHMSLFLFFSGLYVFLAPINRTVTLTVIPIILCCAVLYGLVTIAPLIDPSSPYETSFSSLLWRILRYMSQIMQRKRWPYRSPYLQRVRNQLALNPSRGSHEVDAGAFMWLFNQISNDKELEIFLESLPGFLGSSNGYRTFSLIICGGKYHATTCFLLSKIVSLANNDLHSTLGQRALACIEALSPLIVATPPVLLRNLFVITPGLRTAAVSDDVTVPMICFRAIIIRYSYVYYPSQPRDRNSTRKTYTSSIIDDIDDIRRALEDVVVSYVGGFQTLGDVEDLVQIYCATLKSKSLELRKWSDSSKESTAFKGLPPISSSFPWFHKLYSAGGLKFSCDIPTVMPGMDWDNIIHGPRLLAFMRATGALEPLPRIPESSLTSHSSRQLSPKPGITSNGDLQTYFLREIHPLLRLLDILGARYQIQVREEPSKYDEVLLLVLRAFGPFDTAWFIYDDRYKRSRVVALLELVMNLRQRPDIIVEEPGFDSGNASVVRRTVDALEIIKHDNLHDFSPRAACSEHLFVSVLYALLTLEREAILNNKPFVLPKSEMTNLISFIQYFQGSDALQVAKKLFQTILTTSDSELSIQDNYPGSHGPPDLWQTRGQWKALHVRIVEARLSVLPRRAILPS